MNYKRILLKLSGEALGTQSNAIDKGILNQLLKQIKTLVKEYGIEIAIVIGGGNMFRGEISESLGFGKNTKQADYMGMMATTINAIGLTAFLNNNGIETIMQNSLKIESISNGINIKEAINALSSKKVVVFGGGTGKPYVSTDTAASIRAIEINANAILIAKNGVDGVYDDDPRINANANFIPKITFKEIIQKKFKVVDEEAMQKLQNKNIDVILFNMNTPNNIINLYKNKQTQKTIIKGK